YKRYLEEQPNASNRVEVEGKVTALEAEIAANPGPPAGQPGAPGQPTAAQEQPGDMPPGDPGAAAAAEPGSDPSASPSPPRQPVAVKPHKKRSYWWVGLIIAGAVTVTIVIAVVAYLSLTSTTTVYANHALTNGPQISNGRMDSHDIGGLTLLR